MQCSQECPNQAEYTFYANGTTANVCGAHVYAQQFGRRPSTYIVRPLTLSAHIADYKANRVTLNGLNYVNTSAV